MAKEICKEAQVLSTTMLAGNEQVATEMIAISKQMEALNNLKELWYHVSQSKIKNTERKMDALVKAKILTGLEEWDKARMSLLKAYASEGNNINHGVKVLEMLDSMTLKDMEWLGKWMGDSGDPQTIINNTKESVARYIASQKSFTDANRIKTLIDWDKKAKKKAVGEIKKLITEDIKLIKDWQNPKHIVSLDDVWGTIKETYKDKDLASAYNSYVVAKVFLSQTDEGLMDYAKFIETKNFSDIPLSIDRVKEIDDLDVLINDIYTHTKDIVKDPTLRGVIKEKLILLMNDEWKLSGKKSSSEYIKDAITLTNVAKLMDLWTSFSQVAKYHSMMKYARDVYWITDLSSEELFHGLIDLINNYDWKGIELWGVVLDGFDLVKILQSATWEDWLLNILKSDELPTEAKLAIAKKNLNLYGVKSEGVDNLLKIIAEARKSPNIKQTEALALKTITNRDIPQEVLTNDWVTANNKIAFFDYQNDMYGRLDGNIMARTKFYDSIAEMNSLKVLDKINIIDRVWTIDDNVEYLFVNNKAWHVNEQLRSMVNVINADREARKLPLLEVVFPRGNLMGNFYVDKWQLRFKTIHEGFYDQLVGTITADTLQNASKVVDGVKITPEELETSALAYFRHIHGLDAGVNADTVKGLVMDMTWIPLSKDASRNVKAWKLADDVMRNYVKSSGVYDIIPDDVQGIVERIRNMDADEISKEITNIPWVVAEEEFIKEHIENFRDELIELRTSWNIVDYLYNKGRIIAYANKGNVRNISIDNIKTVFREGNYKENIKNLFIWDIENLTDKQIDTATEAIANDILRMLEVSFSDNLIRQGFSMPLISPKEALYSYLKWDAWLDSDFMVSFAVKNRISDGNTALRTLIENNLPTNLDVNPVRGQGFIMLKSNFVVKEVKNDFIPEAYSVIKSLSPEHKTAVLYEWEGDFIKQVLDKYYNKLEELIEKDGKIDFFTAQQLKLQAGRALDVIEQDIMLGKYNKVLTSEQLSSIMGRKYHLGIALTKDELPWVAIANAKIMSEHADMIKNIGVMTAKNTKEEVAKELIEKGFVATDINWQKLILKLDDRLKYLIDNAPRNIPQLKALKDLPIESIRQMSNKDKYVLAKVIEYLDIVNTNGNIFVNMMYKLNPSLRQIDFFKNFALNEEWIPYILKGNVTELDDAIDVMAKSNIVQHIGETFTNTFMGVSEEKLRNIIKTVVDAVTNDDELKVKLIEQYAHAFDPYTKLKGLPADVKRALNGFLAGERDSVLKELLESDNEVLNIVKDFTIEMPDGSMLSVDQVLSSDIDNRMPSLFSQGKKVNLPELVGLSENEIRNGLDEVYSLMNNVEKVYDAERGISLVVLNNVRSLLKQYTTTNRLLEADYAIGGLNDSVVGLMKSNVFNFNLWLVADALWLGNFMDVSAMKKWLFLDMFKEDNWKTVQSMYNSYYVQSLETLKKIKPWNKLEETALALATYFKSMEGILGSADGALGVSTSKELNKAFYNIGQVVNRANSQRQVMALMNGIMNNQFFRFFGFAHKWDAFYFEMFSKLRETLNRYGANYVDWINVDVQKFNQLFNSNFTAKQFGVIFQWLSWVTIWWGRLERVMDAVNQFLLSSSWLNRALISYPFQLATAPFQSIAYQLKEDWFRKALGIDDFKWANAIREKYGTLVGEYIENPIKLSLPWKMSKAVSNYIAKFDGTDITEAVDKAGISLNESSLSMYGKVNDYVASNLTKSDIYNTLDAVRDNANNIIDAIFAKNFKTLAFVKALQTNNVMQFTNAEQFAKFMSNTAIDRALKDKVMNSVNIYAGRIFKDMLWTGYSGMDRIIGTGGGQKFLIGLMNMINFRGAWGQNIFKQTFEKIGSFMLLSKYINNKESFNQALTYLTKSPEFTNFTTVLFNDLVNAWKLSKYMNNWDEDVNDDGVVNYIDLIAYIPEAFPIVSQQWQGLASFWPARVVGETASSAYNTWTGRPWYNDPIGAGAFLSSLTRNLLRNWKWPNFVANMMRSGIEGNGVLTYLYNEFHTLSAGSLRYILGEAYNSYGYNVDAVWSQWGFNRVIVGEQRWGLDSDYKFNVQAPAENWENMKNMLNPDGTIEDRVWYGRNLFSSLVNNSQFFRSAGSIYNGTKYAWGLITDNPELKKASKSKKPSYDITDWEVFEDNKTYKELMSWGKYTLETPQDYKDIATFAIGYDNPWGYNGSNGLFNYIHTGTISGKESKWYNKDMEEFYSRIGKDRLTTILDKATELAGNGVEKQKFLLDTMNNILEDEFADDPHYLKYKKEITRWAIGLAEYQNRVEWTYNNNQEEDNKDLKISVSETYKDENLNYKIRKNFIDKYYDVIAQLDYAKYQDIGLRKIARDMDKEIASKFFTEDTYEDEFGNKVESFKLAPPAKASLLKAVEFAKYANDWKINEAIDRLTSLTQSVAYKDPTGVARASIVSQTMDYINSLDIASNDKAEMIAKLIINNIEVAGDGWALEKELGTEVYNEAMARVNEILYKGNSMIIENAVAWTKPETDKWKRGKIWGGGWWRGTSLMGLQSKIHDMFTKTAQYSHSENFKQSPTPEIAPIVIAGTYLLWDLTPKRNKQQDLRFIFWEYKPITDTSPKKDIKRKTKVKKPKTSKTGDVWKIQKTRKKV